MEFINEVALITGSTRGIGKEIALKFAGNGAAVIINGVSKANVETTVKEFKDKGYNVIGCDFDTSNSTDVKTKISEVTQKIGPISILVNNAGISPKKDGKSVQIKDMPYEEWIRVIDVNLNGVFNCCQAVIPAMTEQRKGKIINISSAFAHYYSDLASSHYITSKAAVIGFTHALCGELARYGINCNTVCPGRTWTDLTRLSPEQINSEFMKAIPMKRFAEVSEIADTVIFLASKHASYINGATIDVNGGIFMS